MPKQLSQWSVHLVSVSEWFPTVFHVDMSIVALEIGHEEIATRHVLSTSIYMFANPSPCNLNRVDGFKTLDLLIIFEV